MPVGMGSIGQSYEYDQGADAMEEQRNAPRQGWVRGSFDNTLYDSDDTFTSEQEQEWKKQYYNIGRGSLVINDKPENKTKHCVGAMCEAVSKKMKKVKECVDKACTRKQRKKSSASTMYGTLGGKKRRRSRKKRKRKRKTRKTRKTRKRKRSRLRR